MEFKLPKYNKGFRFECSSVGSDESGTGSLFGSCSFAAFKVTVENLKKLKQFPWFSQITDSKKLSDETNIKILKDIKKSFIPKEDYFIWNMKVSTYNLMFERFFNTEYKDTRKISDRIKCIGHNYVHRELHEPTTFHAIDNFLGTNIDQYYEHQNPEDIVFIDKFFNKGGFAILSIALASILARGSYLENLQKTQRYLKIEISDIDNHNKPRNVLELIFDKLEKQGISRERAYLNYCKTDQVKKYKKELKKLSKQKSNS